MKRDFSAYLLGAFFLRFSCIFGAKYVQTGKLPTTAHFLPQLYASTLEVTKEILITEDFLLIVTLALCLTQVSEFEKAEVPESRSDGNLGLDRNLAEFTATCR